MSKRMVAIAILTAVAALAFAGGAGDAAAPEEVTIRWRMKQGTNPWFEAIDGFRAEFPDIKVELEASPGEEYYQKLLTDFAAGVAPDIVWTGDVLMGQYAARGMYQDLNPLAEQTGYDLSVFENATVASVSYEGKLMYLPWGVAPKVLYYNTRAFDEVGLAYPDGNWTNDDLLAAAKKLTKTDAQGNVVRWGYAANGGWGGDVFDMVYGNGGSYLNADKTKTLLGERQAVEGIQWLADLINVHRVAPPLQLSSDEGWPARFQKGEIAMMWGSNWTIPALNPEDTPDSAWRIALLPKGPVQRWNFLWNGGMAMTAKTEHPMEAWELMRYYYRPETVRSIMGVGGQSFGAAIPARRDLHPVWLETAEATFGDRGFDKMLEAIQYARLPELTASFNEQGDIITRELEAVFAGRASASQVLRERVVPAINEVLAAD